jgi:hypothetical protein
MQKKFSLLSLIFLFTSLVASAQFRDAALGIRLSPDGAGFTGKYFTSPNQAVEAQINGGGVFAYEGESVIAVFLIEGYQDLAPQWRGFLGGGGHVGSWDRELDRSRFALGLDGIIGIEHMLKDAPVAFSLDFKPAINFTPKLSYFPHNSIGLAVRYYFSKSLFRAQR